MFRSIECERVHKGHFSKHGKALNFREKCGEGIRAADVCGAGLTQTLPSKTAFIGSKELINENGIVISALSPLEATYIRNRASMAQQQKSYLRWSTIAIFLNRHI
ncbi:hypothetical protein CDAR_559361 [Caerostris darwini]|uniref:Uncharacterized protein n=1 Tax=Caerostris darwini TaxID=1538125 RepID=A0AAV4NZ79_9ARAC|nr:hypothetical protein CDAR_559361 [Caerostris darwini]